MTELDFFDDATDKHFSYLAEAYENVLRYLRSLLDYLMKQYPNHIDDVLDEIERNVPEGSYLISVIQECENREVPIWVLRDFVDIYILHQEKFDELFERLSKKMSGSFVFLVVSNPEKLKELLDIFHKQLSVASVLKHFEWSNSLLNVQIPLDEEEEEEEETNFPLE